MSTLEKVIGIAAIFIIAIVFLVVLFILLALLGRWQEKGINPFKKFPHNKKGRTLSNAEQRALNIGAILAETNSDFCNSLQTSKTRVKRTISNILSRDWGIISSESAIQQLEKLKDQGHRQIFNIILKNAAEVLDPSHTFEDYRQIYGQVGMLLIDKRMLEEYASEIALLEKHIDVLFDASSYEEAEQHKSLFGDDETFSKCVQLYQLMLERCNDYVSYIDNLKQTLPELQERGFVDDVSELAYINATAWDMGRIVNVSRYSYDCGYISESQAWEYIFFAEKQSALCYNDWGAFGKAYVIGRAIWGGKNLNLTVTMDNVELLQKHANSPWLLASLK